MQRVGGLLLMLAGISLGTYTFLPPPNDGKEALREVTRISAAPDRGQFTVSAMTRTGLVAAAQTSPSRAAETQKGGDTAAVSKPASTWSAIVSPTSQGKLTSPKPGDENTRAQLARDLQTELRRVGCYAGEITGTWSPASKRAMSAFMDRVNATLPVNEPDYILLTLVQGHAAKACGAACPAGQTAAENGRCIPQAVVARDTRKAVLAEERRVAAARKTDEQRAEERRLVEVQQASERRKQADADAAAGRQRSREQEERRRIAAASAALKPAGTSMAETATQSAEKLPWLNDDLALAAPEAAPAPRREGMMSIGGPRVAKAEVPESANIVPPPVAPTATEDGTVPPLQGAPGTKSGVAIQGLPGSKSGVAVRGLPGTKSGPAAKRTARLLEAPLPPPVAYGAKPARLKAAAPPRRLPPPVVVVKPKSYYYASSSGGRRSLARPGSNAYNMLQAMGSIF